MATSIDPKAIRYLLDADGRRTDAVVPIELWREIASKMEAQWSLEEPVLVERVQQARQTPSASSPAGGTTSGDEDRDPWPRASTGDSGGTGGSR